MAGCGCGGEITISDQAQRKVLWTLLAINALMFGVELLAGVLAESTGLIADALDMLADAGVYGIALYAVGRSARGKHHAAMTSGVLQMLLALLVLGDVARRLVLGSAPAPEAFSTRHLDTREGKCAAGIDAYCCPWLGRPIQGLI